MSLTSISTAELPTATNTVLDGDGAQVLGYTADKVVATADTFHAQAACETCEEDGIHATDDTGSYDCYACGKRTLLHATGADTDYTGSNQSEA